MRRWLDGRSLPRLTGAAREDVRAGLMAALPVTPGVLPFAFVTGLTARDAGHVLSEAFGLSMILYAGASQMASLELLREGAPLWVILLTVGALNSRMMMYSATLAPSFVGAPLTARLAMSYLVTDHSFALSAAEYTTGRRPDVPARMRFFAGIAVLLWSTWQVGTLAGVLLADRAPQNFPLAFAAPLIFLALLGTNVTDRPRIAAAVVAGSTTIALVGMPANIGMPIGAVLGVTTGTVLTLRKQRRLADAAPRPEGNGP
jgi:predicted branched-subunit amino acid permease